MLLDGLDQGGPPLEIGALARKGTRLFIRRPLALSFREELLDVAGDYVTFQVYTIAGLLTS